MQFSAREDIEAPIHSVFDMVADFDRFERMAMRRGVDVRRTTGGVAPSAGMAWETEFKLRGKPRQMSVLLTDCDPLANAIRGDRQGHDRGYSG